MKTIYRVFLCIVGTCSTGVCQVSHPYNCQYPAALYWSFDNTPNAVAAQSSDFCPGYSSVGMSVAPLTGTQVKYRQGGMLGPALIVDSTTNGYYVRSSTSPYSGAYAWMVHVWVNTLGVEPQIILWNEGSNTQGQYIAGFALAISSDGHLTASVGKGRFWQLHISSKHKIGPLSWHHVALVWDTQNIKLYLNGVLETSVAYTQAPDWAPVLSLGTWANMPTSYQLNGALDEVKLVNFTPAPCQATDCIYENILKHEFGIAYRNQFLQDLATIFDPNIPRDPFNPSFPNLNRFNSPTFDATSEIRAAVNAMYPQKFAALPQDPMSPMSGVLDYVYPARGGPISFNASAAPPRYSAMYASVNWNVPGTTSPAVTNWCGGASLMLWATFRAFGFETRREDWTGDHDFQYGVNSHALTEVFISDYQHYVMQDGLFNISGVVTTNGTTTPNSIIDMSQWMRTPGYSPSAFSNGGYSLNTDPQPCWNVSLTSAPCNVNYKGYFAMPVLISPSYGQ